MPIIPGLIDTQSKHTNTGIYPEEYEIANALRLLCLMIKKPHLRI